MFFWCFEAFSSEIDKNLSFRSKKSLSQKEAMSYPERIFFFSNEQKTGQIQSKSVLNFKMSHIEQFTAILVFGSFSLEIVKHYRYGAKSGNLTNKLRIDGIRHFLIKHVKLDKYSQKLFCTSK